MYADNIKCFTSYKLSNRCVQHIVLFKDGSEYRYKTRINFVILMFFDTETCYDLEHILECYNW